MSNHFTLCVFMILSHSLSNVALGYLRMSWWLSQPGTTRSHPELGRETGSRQWYFGLSRGRVGLCQLFLKYPLPISTLLLSSLLFPHHYMRDYFILLITTSPYMKKIKAVILNCLLIEFNIEFIKYYNML